MADDLDDEWWNENPDANEHEQTVEEEPEDSINNSDSPSKRKSHSVRESEDGPPRKKKKSKRKKISDFLSEKKEEPIKYTDMILAIHKHYGGRLSAVEKDDMSLSERNFTSCGSVSDTLSSYLHTIMTVSKWKKKVKAMEKSPGAPLLLVVCSAASRAVNLIRDLRMFCPDQCKTAKLFAKHMKLEDQTKFLKKNVIQAGVGTPNRIAALLDSGFLSLHQTCLVVLDWSWRDAKLRRLVDIPEIREDLYKLLQKYLIPHVKSGTAKFALL